MLAKPWTKNSYPRRILIIRLQAMGDLVITLPYIQSLRKQLPSTVTIDLLTRKEVAEIPRSLRLFNKVYTIGGKRNFKKQWLIALSMLPNLVLKRYDVVIDLQYNKISRMVRKAIHANCWSEFDRFSPVSAAERTRNTFALAGFECKAVYGFAFSSPIYITTLLKDNGWDGVSKLFVINPAGFFSSRNWPMENYIAFAERWLAQFPQTQLLMLGIEQIKQKADKLKEIFGDKLINLVNKTTAAQAFGILQKAQLVLSEDSGLMHMAWVSGIPTVTLFGSTRSDWSAPQGKHSLLLDSADLPCGNCMLAECKFGDNHCLTRFTAGDVFIKAVKLLEIHASDIIEKAP